ncbi:MAG: hypothetical protein BLITH_0713 [Brockia lithotrophica]|uniref:Uncharacterized protein n=1 Tax=Brockia lithotrophica TaxID=933949 RepID=A0A2T5G8L9_9BACL|nr:MAG: hypothetical protein BLITH_0713 [Brockia lithotrophica]
MVPFGGTGFSRANHPADAFRYRNSRDTATPPQNKRRSHGEPPGAKAGNEVRPPLPRAGASPPRRSPPASESRSPRVDERYVGRIQNARTSLVFPRIPEKRPFAGRSERYGTDVPRSREPDGRPSTFVGRRCVRPPEDDLRAREGEDSPSSRRAEEKKAGLRKRRETGSPPKQVIRTGSSRCAHGRPPEEAAARKETLTSPEGPHPRAA